MYENTRKHYRVAKREIYEDPYEGVYVTKDEQEKYFFATIGLLAVSIFSMLLLILKKK